MTELTYDDLLLRERLRKEAIHLDGAEALRLLGKRDEIHPRDVFALVYRDEELARQSARLNHEHYGHDVLGPVKINDGFLVCVDFRKVLGELDRPVPPTDPALPDDHR